MYQDIDGSLTDEQADLKAGVHRFAREVARPASLVLDRLDPAEIVDAGSPLWDVFRAWYEFGYHTAGGGAPLTDPSRDPVVEHIVDEKLGWGASDMAIGRGLARLPFEIALLIAALTGNSEVRDEFIEPFLHDRDATYIGCWAITEPAHGFDALGVGTETFRVPATAGACRARPPLASPGIGRGEPLDKLGQRALNLRDILFDEVRIPDYCMLALPDVYSEIVAATLAAANAGMGAVSTGLARAAFEEALDYSKNRIQGGKPIEDHQLVQG